MKRVKHWIERVKVFFVGLWEGARAEDFAMVTYLNDDLNDSYDHGIVVGQAFRYLVKLQGRKNT